MQLFPVNYITSDLIKLLSFIFLSPLLLNPSSTCKAHWDVLFEAPMAVSRPSSPITPENIAGFRRWEEFIAVLPTHPDEQATSITHL